MRLGRPEFHSSLLDPLEAYSRIIQRRKNVRASFSAVTSTTARDTMEDDFTAAGWAEKALAAPREFPQTAGETLASVSRGRLRSGDGIVIVWVGVRGGMETGSEASDGV
ncbi:hypothetical protein RUND412_008449 [Rhizina undulata]